MIDPITYFARKFVLSRDRSETVTAMMPLSKVTSATVFVDSAAEDGQAAFDSVNQYFRAHNIPVNIIFPIKGDLCFPGRIKDEQRLVDGQPREEDLFISLVSDHGCFAAEYEACCSTAKFKIGAIQYSGKVMDMVVSVPVDSQASQVEIFSAIKDYLSKIQ